MKSLLRSSVASLIAGIFLWIVASVALAATNAGVVTHLSGTLSVKRTDGTSKLLSVKSEVFPGDVLTTESETFARIKFTDGGEIVLRPETQMKLDAYMFDQAKPESGNSLLSLVKGGFRAVTGLIGKTNHANSNFNTPTATIGIRGTHFGALFCSGDCGRIQTTSGKPPADGLHVDVASGSIALSNSAGQVQVNSGQFGYVGGTNVPPSIVPPQQGIQVTMPSSISQNNSTGRGIDTCSP